MQVIPLSAKPVLSAQAIPTTLASGSSTLNVSLVGAAYFMVLLGIGYAVNWYYIFRKNKNEKNAE